MIVVSGCPRSGTSLMMLLHREALGEDRIIGQQWVGLGKPSDPYLAACRDYVSPGDKQQAKTRSMNPDGFWESRWSVRGIQWVQQEPPRNSVCKIVSQGLANSNPAYIDRVVFMVRHPWAVAKSQQDLVNPIPVAGRARNRDVGHASPVMYLQVTAAAARWVLANRPTISLIEYEDLLADPASVMPRLESISGEGNWHRAMQAIKPNYHRSTPERLGDGPEWDAAMDMHERLKRGNWQGVISVWEAYRSNQPKASPGFFCPRWGGTVANDFCKQCSIGDPSFISNLIAAAKHRKRNWQNEPCLWECGQRPDRENYTPLTIEQSIADNHWAEAVPQSLWSKIKSCEGCARRRRRIKRAAGRAIELVTGHNAKTR